MLHPIYRVFFTRVLFLFFFTLIASPSQGQSLVDRALDFFQIPLNKKQVARDSSLYPAKLVLAPVLVFEPATSLGVGVGAKILFKFKGSGEETRTSNMPISAIYTLKNQIILSSGYTIFFNQEKWYLKGNLEFSKFPQSYYGVGNQTLAKDEEIFSFTNFLIEPLLLKRISKNLFLGGGVRYNIITNTEVEPEGELIREQPSGFDGSNSAGLELALVWDSRDNVLNATKGNFLEIKQGFYEKAVGGTNTFRFNQVDFRSYFQPWKKREDVIAFHLGGRFAWGDVPLAELSILGGPENARGYREGRYRDLNSIIFQSEYRWQIWKRFGMVFYAEAGDVFRNVGDFDFGKLKYGAGLGIRIKIAEEENLNIRLDYGLGFGFQFANNYYLGIAEAF